MRGNCYVTCEALWHLLGGPKSGWKPMYVKHEGDTHWFLKHLACGGCPEAILDPTISQFKSKPDYTSARGCGFLTSKPSKRAKKMMRIMVWQTGHTK